MLWFPEYFKDAQMACDNNSNSSDNTSSLSFISSTIYLDSLYVALATLPGLLVGIFTINYLGAKLLLGRVVVKVYMYVPFVLL